MSIFYIHTDAEHGTNYKTLTTSFIKENANSIRGTFHALYCIHDHTKHTNHRTKSCFEKGFSFRLCNSLLQDFPLLGLTYFTLGLFTHIISKTTTDNINITSSKNYFQMVFETIC